MNQSDNHQRSREELIAEFRSQEKLIFCFMNQIVERKYDFYKPLAASFRILFHHKGANKSLFNQLNIEEKIEMVSTSSRFDPANVLPFLGLLTLQVESNSASYSPIGLPSQFRTLPFEK